VTRQWRTGPRRGAGFGRTWRTVPDRLTTNGRAPRYLRVRSRAEIITWVNSTRPSDPRAEGGVSGHGTVRQGTAQSPPSRDHGATRQWRRPAQVGPACISSDAAEPRPTLRPRGYARRPAEGGTTRRAVSAKRPPGAHWETGKPPAHGRYPNGRGHIRLTVSGSSRGRAWARRRISSTMTDAMVMALRHERARSGWSCPSLSVPPLSGLRPCHGSAGRQRAS
jgi:hypothetical protein